MFHNSTILTDGEEAPRIARPVRKTKPTTTLLHTEEPALPFQRKTVQEFHIAEAAKHAAERQEGIDAV